MRMDDPIPTFLHLVKQMVKRFPDLSYIHLVEPRVAGNEDTAPKEGEVCFSNLPTVSTILTAFVSQTTSSALFGARVRSSVPVATPPSLL